MVNSTDKKNGSPDFKKPVVNANQGPKADSFADKIRQPESDVSYITDNQIAGTAEHIERRPAASKK